MKNNNCRVIKKKGLCRTAELATYIVSEKLKAAFVVQNLPARSFPFPFPVFALPLFCLEDGEGVLDAGGITASPVKDQEG